MKRILFLCRFEISFNAKPNKRRSHTPEALILVGQGISSVEVFAKCVGSDAELLKEIVDPLLICKAITIDGKDVIVKSLRTKMAMRATWKLAWDDARNPDPKQLVGETSPAPVVKPKQLVGAETPAADATEEPAESSNCKRPEARMELSSFETDVKDARTQVEPCLNQGGHEILGQIIIAKRMAKTSRHRTCYRL